MFTQEYDYRELADAYEKLGTYKAVQSVYGCSSTPVHRAVKMYGKPKGYGGNPTHIKITDEQLIKEIETFSDEEIAEKYGMHITQVEKRRNKLGIANIHNMSVQEAAKARGKRALDKTIERGPAFIEEITNGEFEFVSYENRKYTIRCKRCGAITTRYVQDLKKYHTTCECRSEIRKLEKLIRKELNIALREAELKAELRKPKVCEECGEVFFSQYKTARYCSAKCRQKAKGSGHSYKKRAERFGCEFDSTVTLKKVYERDNGICQLCGKLVSWDSNEWNNRFGPEYPTIDHIIPLSKGGPHSWDNVQLAHAMCNSCKRDLTDDYDIKEAIECHH